LIEITKLNKYRDTELQGLGVRPNLQYPSCMPRTGTLMEPSEEVPLIAFGLQSLSWPLIFQRQLFFRIIDKVNFVLTVLFECLGEFVLSAYTLVDVSSY
jgi:hypothetical protein